MDDKLEFGKLLERVSELALQARTPVFMYLVAMSVFGSILDLKMSESAGYMPLSSLAGLIAGYLLMRGMLGSAGLLGGTAAFGAYFGLSILIGLGTVLGLVFLVVPGIVVAVRWLPAYALLMSGEESASAAPGASWDLTEGNFWPLFAALAVGLLPLFLGVGLIGYAEGEADPQFFGSPWYIGATVFANVLMSVFTIFISALGIAAYTLLKGDRGEMAEVFA